MHTDRIRVLNGVMIENTLVVSSIGLHHQSVMVKFDAVDMLMERTGTLADAMPGDVYELRRVREAAEDAPTP